MLLGINHGIQVFSIADGLVMDKNITRYLFDSRQLRLKE